MTAKEDGHGRVKIPFTVKGSRFYRLVGDIVGGTKGATSPATRFTKGPKKLGEKVLYVNTDDFKDPVVRKAPYEANAVMVADGQITKPFRVDEFAVRGNTTATKIKKPYKMKFKKARRPFGLPEDKTWVLLANFQDRTLVRNQIAYNIGAGLDGLRWTPRGTFVELFLNGEYKGSYQISESIKIDKNRINIDKNKGIVVEVDKHYEDESVPGFFGDHQIPYAFKDPDERKKGKEYEEGITDDKIAGMKSRILAFEKVLYGSDFDDPEEGWTKYLDIDSAVDFYIAKEFTKENDSDFYRSTFFYIPDYTSPSSKFVMGPIWDFDRSAGAKPDAVETRNDDREPEGMVAARQRVEAPQHHAHALVRPAVEGPGLRRRAREAVGREAWLPQGHRRSRRGAGGVRGRCRREERSGSVRRNRQRAIGGARPDVRGRDRLPQGLVPEAVRLDGQRAPLSGGRLAERRAERVHRSRGLRVVRVPAGSGRQGPLGRGRCSANRSRFGS